ncbi:MAG: hypothetical protein KME20_17135 [Kaiparowitsia implicata GSE-PSE-MK54-09C]|jgi:hypothetical protein|nr:hypothetical protein [Kaiparowitsia implicata GSE-PSE-MK54-09C]
MALGQTFNRFMADNADNLVARIEASLQASLERWLLEHRIIGFFWHHPPMLVLAGLGILILLSGLWRAISRGSEQIWIALLSLPLRLLHLVGLGSIQWLRRRADPTPQTRLAEITARLDDLSQEQEALLKELRGLLKLGADERV